MISKYAFAKNVSYSAQKIVSKDSITLPLFPLKSFSFQQSKGEKRTHTHSQVYTNTQQSCVCVCVWARVANNAVENRLHSSDYKKISDWISVFISNVNSNKQEMCPECISKMSSVWVKIDKFNWNQFNNVIH